MLKKWYSNFLAYQFNRRLSVALRKVAFGQDFPKILSNVSTKPHRFTASQASIEKEITEKMLENAQSNLSQFISTNRESLTLINETTLGGGNILDEKLTGLYGTELVHTSYFLYEDIVNIVAGIIINAEKQT